MLGVGTYKKMRCSLETKGEKGKRGKEELVMDIYEEDKEKKE